MPTHVAATLLVAFSYSALYSKVSPVHIDSMRLPCVPSELPVQNGTEWPKGSVSGLLTLPGTDKIQEFTVQACGSGESVLAVPARLYPHPFRGRVGTSKHLCRFCDLVQPLSYKQIRLKNYWMTYHSSIDWFMFLHPNAIDNIVSASFKNSFDGNGGFEEGHKAVFYRIIMEAIKVKGIANPLVLDIGANIGIHSFFLAALGAETHAFEPTPVNWRVLSCTWDANPGLQKRLFIHNAALSNETKKLCMNQVDGNLGHSNVDLQATCDNPSETWVLDTFWQKTLGKRHVFFVKIDIEGFEPFAIKGGMQMFREAPPMIISMEVTPRDSASRGLTVHDMMKDLYDIGYTARTGPEFSNSPIIKPGTPRWDQLFINNPDLSDIILIHKKTYEKYLQGSVQTFSNP